MRFNITFQRMVCAAAVALVTASTATACKVPVFRYGLEHWEPDPYQAVIVYRGALGDEAEALATRLEAIQENADNVVNLKVTRVNVEEIENAADELLSQALGKDYRDKVSEPEIVLLYPRESYSGPLAWRGKLSAANIDAIVDSPARRTITKMILGGESAVWVLIGVGDEEKDKAAENVLRKELAYLEEHLEMRDVEVIQSDSKFGEEATVELRLGLKLIVLDPKDPKEEVFVKLLMRSEDDLEDLGEPVATPVFGRGRAYLPLAGKGINAELIAETC
ncbi:MAG: hypothetical protein MI757_21950, partial [Pirellulales bacterium]|nr:hypothetical protein [Pirellulales bacterium]